MTIALSLLFVAVLLATLFSAAITPNRAKHSSFERKRRHAQGEDMTLENLRERRFGDMKSLLAILFVVLLILLSFSAIWLFGVWFGLLFMLVFAFIYGFMARMVPLRRFAQRLYDEQEVPLLQFVQRNISVFKWLRHDNPPDKRKYFESKDELKQLILLDHIVLDEHEKKLLTGALEFNAHRVDEIMTPFEKLFTIKKSEILGPLVLDDLHKSGHDSFPVTNNDEMSDIVGILRLRDVQTLDTTRRHTAKVETAMDPDVRTIAIDEMLESALKVMLDSQHHMIFVVNQHGSVAGMLTLSDIVRQLFGNR